MDSIRIDSGDIRLQINDGPNYLEFNPADVKFVEKFYSLVTGYEEKYDEYIRRASKIDADATVDERGLPVNFEEGIALLKDICEFVRSKIDEIFGEGISQALFGDSYVLDHYMQFFQAIVPFVEAKRDSVVKKYTVVSSDEAKVMK